MPSGSLLAIAASDRWLLAFALAALAVLVGGTLLRRAAKHARARARARGEETRGLRRSAGVLLVAGPLVGFLTSPTFGEHALIAVVGAVALAVIGVAADRRPDADRLIFWSILVVATLAVVAGVRVGPTGVDVLDLALAVGVVALATAAANGFGNTEGLASTFGAEGALGVLALAGFAHQDSLAAVAAGLAGACIAFLAFNLRPASLFVGRGGRLAIGYVLAVGALSVDLPIEPIGRLLVPAILLGLLLLDGLVVAIDRVRRRQSLAAARRDHLLHRLESRRWSTGEAIVGLLVAQLGLVLLAVFTGRGVLAVGLGVLVAAIIVGAIGIEATRAQPGQEPARGLPRGARIAVGVGVALVAFATLPAVLAVPDVKQSMEAGRSDAARALAAAREGDAATAELSFRRAAGSFQEASDQLHGTLLAGGTLVPGLASNLRAARTLADIGLDLAKSGENVTAAVDPTALEVVDGRLPLDQVHAVTPALEDGRRALDDALSRLQDLDDPYQLSVVGEARDDISRQLRRAAKEARNAAAAARLAPVIFGEGATRTYLLIVQNNAELRATGGLIGNWALLTVADGKVSVGEMHDPSEFNAALGNATAAQLDVPAGFLERFPFRPQFAMQDANVSEDFPTAARILTSLAPDVGLPELDGVLAVDPVGLAALLELTGPVRVAGWPEDVTASNVVDITLRDQYAKFENDPRRNTFLGDVAREVVDTATSTNLGSPAKIAKVLGGAAHEGHVQLAFARPKEQRLAEQLEVAGELAPVRSDSLAVNTQNAAANKIDYYLDRRIEYRVHLEPDADLRAATVQARLTIRLENTAPATGLPRIVIGPFDENYVAGENRSLVSVYSPLGVLQMTVDGQPVDFTAGTEAGRSVYSHEVAIPAQSVRTVRLHLSGRIRLRPESWYDLRLDHQPTIEPDRIQTAVQVAQGWEVLDAPGMVQPFDRLATGVVHLDRDRRVRVEVAPKPPALNLWERLEAGT